MISLVRIFLIDPDVRLTLTGLWEELQSVGYLSSFSLQYHALWLSGKQQENSSPSPTSLSGKQALQADRLDLNFASVTCQPQASRKLLILAGSAFFICKGNGLFSGLNETETLYSKIIPGSETLLCQQRFIWSKLWFFSVVMYGCESWTVKKAEHRRIDAFELQCWRRLLRVPWTARRSNQSMLKEISPEYSLEGLMLKLQLQYFGHLM